MPFFKSIKAYCVNFTSRYIKSQTLLCFLQKKLCFYTTLLMLVNRNVTSGVPIKIDWPSFCTVLWPKYENLQSCVPNTRTLRSSCDREKGTSCYKSLHLLFTIKDLAFYVGEYCTYLPLKTSIKLWQR